MAKAYGKKDVIIDVHFEKIDTLQPVRDGADAAALRSFQLNIQSHISVLETLEVPSNTFGGLLGSRLIKMIPFKLQQEWAKSPNNKTTDIERILNFIGEQVDIAERLSRIRGTEKPVPQAKASQLAIGAKIHSVPRHKQQPR